MNSENIHVLWVTSGQYSCIDTSIHALLELEYTKAVTRHRVKVGGGIDQGPTTQATYLRSNQPSRFCSVYLTT